MTRRRFKKQSRRRRKYRRKRTKKKRRRTKKKRKKRRKRKRKTRRKKGGVTVHIGSIPVSTGAYSAKEEGEMIAKAMANTPSYYNKWVEIGGDDATEKEKLHCNNFCGKLHQSAKPQRKSCIQGCTDQMFVEWP